VSDEDVSTVGWEGDLHRRFLADFFRGRFPGSYARGADFQIDPITGEARTSGTAASLAGIEAALVDGDPEALDHGIRRLLLLYSVALTFGGIPLVYMGDELALTNDRAWRERAHHVADNRWMHRRDMDWSRAAERHDDTTVAGEVFGWMLRMVRGRAALETLHAACPARFVSTGDDRVLAFRRHHPRHAPFVGVANLGDDTAWLPRSVLGGLGGDAEYLVLHNGVIDHDDGESVGLAALSFAWFSR
jgi:amylosucrase